jgi:hypothetical protein
MSAGKRIARWISDYDNPNSIGSRFRAKRARRFLDLVSAAQGKARIRILDIGGTRTYWKIIPRQVLEQGNLSITLVNLPGQARNEDDSIFRFVDGDGCDLSMFENDSFDIVHSNSVLEHVGDWSRMKAFAREVRRLAPRYFVQTPNFWFPIEPHFMFPGFQWLPEPARVRLLMRRGFGHFPRAKSVDDAVAAVQSARLVNRNMLASLFHDAKIITERVALLPKSLMAIRSSRETSRATTRE